MDSKKQEIKEQYDKTADIYDKRYGDIQEEKYRIMLEDLQLKEPIFDLGSGTGMLQKYLKGKLYGLDISFASLKKSSEIAVQGDAEQLPYKDNTFSTVLSFTTAQNLADVEKMLAEIARVLKQDGIAVITILAKFRNKLSAVEKYFRIIEIKTCGEDIGLVLTKVI
jgi:demethylmenaquinone methyltransferase/2-methoxy-6-polyprenyl-1,4-benzoquinol methylase